VPRHHDQRLQHLGAVLMLQRAVMTTSPAGSWTPSALRDLTNGMGEYIERVEGGVPVGYPL
jgi:hypothetical protein